MHLSKICSIALCWILFSSVPAIAEITEGGTGLAYGTKHAYFLTAPHGWMLDTDSGKSQHIFAAFYPKGSSWSDGDVVMYSNAAARDNKTPEQAIEDDYKELKKKSSKLKIEDGGTLTTRDKKQAVVKYFKGDKWGNTEAVGYVVEPTVVANIVMSARTAEAFEASLPAFRQLVASYRFVTDDPDHADLSALVRAEHQKEVRGEK